MRHALLAPVGLGALLSVLGCASTTTPATADGPTAEIPVFQIGDPRVGTAGFVAKTLRLHEEADGVRYTLMAFVVGDTLTIGAMVKGAFQGRVHWRIGERELDMPFDSAAPGATTTAVSDDAAGTGVAAQGAAFQGTAWVNVEVPVAEWIADGTPLQLEFRSATGSSQVLPDPGFHYRAHLVTAP